MKRQLLYLYLAINASAQWSINPPPAPTPPAVLELRPGRQLFVDDWLIESTDLTRTYHKAQEHPASPVIGPTEPWENNSAQPFSDGAWWDGERFRMYYRTADHFTAVAFSTNGIDWKKHGVVVDHSALVQYSPGAYRDSGTVWLDRNDPDCPWKMAVTSHQSDQDKDWCFYLYRSPDGFTWGNPVRSGGEILDRSTVFWNPFLNKWFWVIKGTSPAWPMRARRLHQSDTFDMIDWGHHSRVPEWMSCDSKDPMRIDTPTQMAELYNLDCNAYESVILGLFSIWQGQPDLEPKFNSVMAGYSRDGINFHRPDRSFLWTYSNTPRRWNYRNTQSVGGSCLVVGDQLYFYASGNAGVDGSRGTGARYTGLMTLRRDGFASMGGTGTLTTRPFRITQPYLFLNFDGGTNGSVGVEVLGHPAYRTNQSTAYGNGTTCIVLWGPNRMSLEALIGQVIQLKFYVNRAKIYSFWFSDKFNGPSYGYVAAGGPGLNGEVDDVGADIAPRLRYQQWKDFVRVSTPTRPGYIYEFQSADHCDGPWLSYHAMYGNGHDRGAVHSTTEWRQKFYRIQVR